LQGKEFFMELQIENEQATWMQLVEGLPSTMEETAKAIRKTLETAGLLHLTWPMSMEHFDAIAGRLGKIVQRSDIKVDPERARNQERLRVIKGRPSVYRPGEIYFHTDPIADLVSWYCLVQDEIGGQMLMLDLGDLGDCFSATDLETLSKVELWSPTRKSDNEQEKFIPVPVLSKTDGKYKIYYAPWLQQTSHDAGVDNVMEKFTAYLKKKEETQLITLPVKPGDTVFLDNHRMLHGRGELTKSSNRHLVRLYIQAG